MVWKVVTLCVTDNGVTPSVSLIMQTDVSDKVTFCEREIMSAISRQTKLVMIICHHYCSNGCDSVLMYCYKIVFGLVCVNTDDFFTFSTTTNTRGHRHKLYKNYCSNNICKNFFLFYHWAKLSFMNEIVYRSIFWGSFMLAYQFCFVLMFMFLLVRERSALADPYCQSAWNSVCGFVCLSATFRSNISKTKGARGKVTMESL